MPWLPYLPWFPRHIAPVAPATSIAFRSGKGSSCPGVIVLANRDCMLTRWPARAAAPEPARLHRGQGQGIPSLAGVRPRGGHSLGLNRRFFESRFCCRSPQDAPTERLVLKNAVQIPGVPPAVLVAVERGGVGASSDNRPADSATKLPSRSRRHGGYRCECRRRGCSGRPRHPRSFSLTSHTLRAVGAPRPATAPAMERAVPERALHLPLVYDVPCACRRLTLADARRSAPVAP
jgi:hypothetical protein